MINQDIQSRVDAFRGNPDALAQRYQQNQQLIDLLALQKIKSEKEAAARQMQMQMAQQQAKQGQPPTVAEQREQEVLDLTKNEVQQQQNALRAQQQQQQQSALQKLLSGIAAAPGAMSAAQPQAMAAGGIVAFQEGGDILEKLREALRAATDPVERAKILRAIESARAGGPSPATRLPPTQTLSELESASPGERAKILRNLPKGGAGVPPEMLTEKGILQRGAGALGKVISRIGGPLSGLGLLLESGEAGRGSDIVPGRSQLVDAQGRPIVDQIPGQTPPTSPSFEDATRRAREQELPAIAQPERPAPPPPPVPRPAAPAAPAAPMATQPPAQPGAGMVSQEEIAAAQKMRKEALDQDPNKLRAAEEARAAGVYGVPAAYRDLLAKRQSELAASTQVDPSKRFLDRLGILAAAGMQDRGRWYGIGPGATPGLMAYDEAAAKRQAAADEAVFNLSKGLMESERTGGIEAYRAGRGALEKVVAQRERAAGDVTQLQRTLEELRSAGLDRASRERIAQMQTAAQRELTAAQREGTATLKTQALQASILDRRERASAMARKDFEKRMAPLLQMQAMAGKLDKNQTAQLDAIKAEMDVAVNSAVAPFNTMLDQLMGGAQAGSARKFSVREKTAQ